MLRFSDLGLGATRKGNSRRGDMGGLLFHHGGHR